MKESQKSYPQNEKANRHKVINNIAKTLTIDELENAVWEIPFGSNLQFFAYDALRAKVTTNSRRNRVEWVEGGRTYTSRKERALKRIDLGGHRTLIFHDNPLKAIRENR